MCFFYREKLPLNYDNIFANSNNFHDLVPYLDMLEKGGIPYTVYLCRPITDRTSGFMDFCIVTNTHSFN